MVDKRLSMDDPEDEEPDREEQGPKPTYVAELEERIAESERMIAEVRSQYRAALEDFENAKARAGRDVSREIRKGRKLVIGEMLEVLDNLDRAIEAAGTDSRAGTIVDGIRLVRDQFVAKLEHLGARRMISLGAKFDPALHQAVSTVPVSDPGNDGTVVGVVTEGYTFEDELLRPAVVAVGKLEALKPVVVG